MTRPDDSDGGEIRGSASDTHSEAAAFPGKGFGIDEFTIVDTLGQGSMATVYLAEDDSGHDVALKIFQEGPGVSQTMLERFKREAQATKKLRRHPHIITVYKTGQKGPYHFIAMQVVEGGGTLNQWMASTTVPPQALVRMLNKIVRALQYAHSRQIIHRDIKPANIMIDEFGEPLLTDFGVASLMDLPSFTLSGALTGTPLYMSPEQAKGETVGPATDIYSMGVVLYEVMTGSLPHGCDRGTPVKDVIRAIVNESPRRLRTYRRDISPDLEAIIMKCLEKEPTQRYVDAEALSTDLRRFLARRPVVAHRFGVMDRLRFFLRRYAAAVGVVGLTLFAAFAIRYRFIHKVNQAQAESLIHYAQIVSSSLQRQIQEGEQTLRTPQVWQEIRRGRKAMLSGSWQQASRIFQSATDRSREIGDVRTMGAARIEQARCEALLDNRSLSMDLYRWVMQRDDVTAVIRNQAQLEFLQLALLSNARDQAMKALLWRRPPDDGPVRQSLDVLTGDLSVDPFVADLRSFPRDFRNDAAFTVSIRYLLNEDPVNAEKWLRRTLRESSPGNEWPAPLARKTFQQLGREDS